MDDSGWRWVISMWRVLRWMTVAFLCCAAGGDAGVEPMDARLTEAQSALDEAQKLKQEGKFASAQEKGEHALALREAVLGGAHPEVAVCLYQLAVIHRMQGNYAQAEPLFQRALAIQEAALGKNDRAVGTTVNGLAVSYAQQGLYSRAQALFERALAIGEATFGKNHRSTAMTLNNLAILHWERGAYGQAALLFERALAAIEATMGANHPDVALALNNLATVYKDQGLYGRAEPLYQRALAIRESALGQQHPDVAESLNNLASLYSEQGLFDRAEPLYQRALAVWETALGGQHPLVAEALNNLATLHRDHGRYGQALPLFERALAIREASLGKNHPLTAATLDDLASLYRDQGMYDRAALLYERALATREAALGEHHPQVAETLTHFAQLRLAQHRLADALPLLTRARSISEQHLRQEVLDLSESRLDDFLQHLRADEERLYALLRAHPRDAGVRQLAMAAVLLLKGRSAEELSNTSHTILRGLGPQDREAFERLRDLRTQFASNSLQGPGELSPDDYRQRLKAFADQGDALEADLARRSAPVRALRALPSPEDIVGRVAASLPKGSALIEFVAYTDRPLVARPGTPPDKLPSAPRYLALLLFSDSRILSVDLGDAAPIDSAVSTLRDALALRRKDFLTPAQALYARVFKPLRPLLGSTRRLLLAPDGQLTLVPFAALHDGKAFLIDSFDFSYLTSGKDLLPRTEDTPASASVVVLADPAFGAPAPSTPEEPSQAQRSASQERSDSSRLAELAEQPWPPLPGTRREAEAIQRLFPQAQLFLGADASKQRLLALHAPAVLHIATHGFFLEDGASPAGTRALGVTGPPSPFFLRPEAPLLHSGLVLTGASSQPPGAAGSSSATVASSLVTALELAGMDLWGTQLVVLSACNTGRGDVRPGLGVYGLRRALAVAGAETLVMSLWKVSDDSTQLLMERFYQNLLAGQGRAAALQQAMLAVRKLQPHPYSWAPFISLGSDAPLRSLTSEPQPAPSSGGGAKGGRGQ